MRKTKRTLLTAALFAASMNMIPAETNAVNAVDSSYDPALEDIQDVYGPAPDYPTPEETTTAAPDIPAITTTTEPFQLVPVYGPPWSSVSTEEKKPDTTTTSSDIPLVTTTTEPFQPVPVYGPPWVMLPEETWLGDLYEDNVIDVYDLLLLRQYITNGKINSYWEEWDKMRADVNKDGEVGMADLITLQRYLLGSIDSLSDKE